MRIEDILAGNGISFVQTSPTMFKLTSYPKGQAYKSLNQLGYVMAASYDCKSKSEFPAYFWHCTA